MQELVQQLANGNITWLTGVVFCLAALALGALGGALGGVLVGGRHIGYGLSAMMGTFFGPIAALPGIVLALVVVVFLRG
jgi:hypothetical protein